MNRKISRFMQAPASPRKVCDENRIKKQEKDTRINVIDGSKPFIRHIQKTGENDLHKLWVNDYGCNEGTIYLVNG